MIDQESDRFVSRLLDELGPADPPAGFARDVMARVITERHATKKRTVPFNQEGIAMTRKAMWGLAAAAAVTLAVFAIKGFPPVGRGTEGTIGAAKKYQEPQIASKDVVLGDVAAQEFLQSEAFDQLLKDPDARGLLTNAAFQAEMKNALFVDILRSASARQTLTDKAVLKVFDSAEARNALESEIRSRMSADAVNKASAADLRGSARADVRALMANRMTAEVLAKDVVRSQLARDNFRQLMRETGAVAAMRGDVLSRAAAHAGFKPAAISGRLASSLIPR